MFLKPLLRMSISAQSGPLLSYSKSKGAMYISLAYYI